MPIVAELGKRLKLSTLSCEAAQLYTNKYLMHCFANNMGIKNAEYKLCSKIEDAIEFYNYIGSPMILKPIDSNASHGVFRINSIYDINKFYEKSLNYSRSKKYVLAERYIAGTEFTVDGIKTPSNHYTLAISEKRHFGYNSNIANELTFTHVNKFFDYEYLKSINDLYVMNSPLKFGLTHAEYKFENGDFFLIEIGARGGGNNISSIISKYMSGYDTYEYLINSSLGIISSKEFNIPYSFIERAAVLKFFDLKKYGIVKEIKGINYLKSEVDVVDFSLDFSIGDRIEFAKNDSERLGYYIACSENIEKLNKVKNLIKKHIQIIVE